MSEIIVKLPAASYKIQIEWESGSVRRTDSPVSSAKRAIVITDEKVWSLYGSRMETALKGRLPDGYHSGRTRRRQQTIESFTKLCGQLADLHVLRDNLIVAFGGGVVGIWPVSPLQCI